MRWNLRTAIVASPALLLACAHARTPQQEAMIQRGDCAELLLAADAARASQQPELAAALTSACSADKLSELVDKSAPEQACSGAAAPLRQGREAANRCASTSSPRASTRTSRWARPTPARRPIRCWAPRSIRSART
jgi:hypothetical protein